MSVTRSRLGWLDQVTNQFHYVMAIPAVLLFSLFFLYPLGRGIWLSLTDWNGFSHPNFIGVANFLQFFRDRRAMHDVLTTVSFALGSAPLLILSGLGLALLLNGVARLQQIARVIVYLPAIISPLIMGYIWYFLIQPERGFYHLVLQRISPRLSLPDWYSQGTITLLVLIVINVWQYAGMTMVVFLAGLQAIPPDVYEAAYVDGANPTATFWYITLPLLKESMKINVVTNIIGSLAVFDIIMALTEGGPGYATESLSIYIMRMCYGNNTGYSTAVAIILFVITLIPVLGYLRLSQRREFDV